MPSDASFRRKVIKKDTYIKIQDVSIFVRVTPPKQSLVVCTEPRLHGEGIIHTTGIR